MRHMILTGAAVLLAVTACGQQETTPDVPESEMGEQEPTPIDPGATGGPYNEEPVQTAEPDEEGADGGGALVLNRYGNENGFKDRRPTDYVATEFTTFSDMEWEEWTDQMAHGEGELSGTWCMEQGCQNDPYDVEVQLGDPVEVDGATYFSTYTVTEHHDMPEEMLQAMEEADGGRLALPSAE
ncbi:hypothetical protein [Nocardiopsis sp. FR4]|uniref:hypothetical protein n=1 Tax=Nocardiopsis sp. FR4 TaxID=2605985 RepID=UPI001357DFE5|nr:hypothetical protein [Nocardiopsis sp. FR4]